MDKNIKPGDQVFYKRNLPHLQPENCTLFITARLAGSLPKKLLQELKEQKEAREKLIRQGGFSEKKTAEELRRNSEKWLEKYQDALDKNDSGPHWFKDPQIAMIWINALQYFDRDRYTVICSTVMSNHVHFIMYELKRSLARIMHSLKSYSGLGSNKILERQGQEFWQAESYDRMVRDTNELRTKIDYTLNNPVKIGLVNNRKDWKYNYIHSEFLHYVRT